MSSNNKARASNLLFSLVAASLLIGCGPKTPTVSFQDDVKPILDAQCVRCHRPDGEGGEKSRLLMDTYEGVMLGTQYGRVVIPGDPLTSVLVMLIEGRADPSLNMPHDGGKLEPEQIALIRNWVEQGALNN